MAMKTRRNVYPYETGIVTEEITNTSRLLGNLTGLTVSYSKPIVGRNAFAHEAGIHQHGVIASRLTYEIMTPESVGRSSNELVLGKHSGKHGLAKRCADLGFELSDEEISALYLRFSELADKKKEVFEDDLRVLLATMKNESFETYAFEQLRTSGSDPAMALVKLRRGQEEFLDTAIGDGPVDAACQAIERIVGVSGRLQEFNIRAASPGKDALGEAHVTVLMDGKSYYGSGASTDIIEAAVKAYLAAVNKYLALRAAV
jgi:2-isopropylmalate synthase